MEKRRPPTAATAAIKSSPLPADYLKLVNEVFTTNFNSGLQALKKLKAIQPYFEASGTVYPDEVTLCVSLKHQGELAATSVYGSADFDPKASTPTVQDLLAACVDAVGSLFNFLLDTQHADRIEQVAQQSLSAFEQLPFEWTMVEVDRYRIYLKVDKANPAIDEMADEWLAKNDPDYQKHLEEEEKETEALFITGPGGKKPPTGRGSGMAH